MARAIGAEVVLLGDDNSDFWGRLGLAFDAFPRDEPVEAGAIYENFDLVVVGDSRLAGHGSDAASAHLHATVRVFLRFRDHQTEPIALAVSSSEDAPSYPGQEPLPESLTVAQGLMRIKYALGHSADDALPSHEAVEALEAVLRLRMVDRLV